MAMTPFQIEAWAEYAIGITILFGRITYRTKLVGWKWAGDDFFAVAAVVFLTVRKIENAPKHSMPEIETTAETKKKRIVVLIGGFRRF